MTDIPHALLKQLKELEPNEEFTGFPPKVRSSSGKVYFVKSGTSAEREQYLGEVESLRAIEAAAPGLSPSVFSSGVDSRNQPFFVCQYKDLCRLGDVGAKVLATRLATELHAKTSKRGYGFQVPTYCGVTRLKNGWFDTWEKCYSSMIGDLVNQLKEKGTYEDLCDLVNEVRERVIPMLLGQLNIQPALLHGDLWSGNVGVEPSQNPIIFDPSSFYGHNEADLAISRIFGGFPPGFYTTYHTLVPKSEPVDQYPHRCNLYEMFHYLNHTLIFGASYERSTTQKAVELLKWARKE